MCEVSKMTISGQFLLIALLQLLMLCHASEKGSVNSGLETSYHGETIIGIDLGTTYSCVGFMENGRVEIIHNDQGNRITPSVVAFTDDGEVIVGNAADNQMIRNPTKTIYAAKRLIGRKFATDSIQKSKKHLPFSIVDKDGDAAVSVTTDEGERIYLPEEISAKVLAKMKEVAEMYLGREVSKAVVTVPAYFNNAQKKATKEAGILAGLEVVRILNEPTAAGIAYGFHHKKGVKTVLVYDLGGGTFDVSLMKLDHGVFRVLATSGDTHLGGDDFDLNVCKYFMEVFHQKTKLDASSNTRAMQRLRKEVERAKRALSFQTKVKVEVDEFYNGHDLSETLTKAKFESLNNALFTGTLNPIKKVLQETKLSAEDVDEVLLIGGSTRIPKIRDLIETMFGKQKISHGINPDEAVAYGATVQAGILSGNDEVDDVMIIDVTAYSLGTSVSGNRMSIIIPKNTELPAKRDEVYVTAFNMQDEIVMPVYEGERPIASHNHLLGQLHIDELPAGPRLQTRVLTTFEISLDGILAVTLKDPVSGNTREKEIDTVSKRAESLELEVSLTSVDYEQQEEYDMHMRQVMTVYDSIGTLASVLEEERTTFATEGEKRHLRMMVDAHFGMNLAVDSLKTLISRAEKFKMLLEDKDADIFQSSEVAETVTDFGPMQRFKKLAEECFVYGDDEATEEVYAFCPFSSVLKVSPSIMKRVKLVSCGKWESWEHSMLGESYTTQVYTNGDRCGNDDVWKTQVTLECGKEDKIKKVTKSAVCSHHLTFETPLRCHEHEL